LVGSYDYLLYRKEAREREGYLLFMVEGGGRVYDLLVI
jgi:hypothetical protein